MPDSRKTTATKLKAIKPARDKLRTEMRLQPGDWERWEQGRQRARAATMTEFLRIAAHAKCDRLGVP